MLADYHRAHLHASAISDEIIKARGYRTIECYRDWYRLTQPSETSGPTKKQTDKNYVPFPGLAIPLYRCGDPEPFVWVARPDRPRMNKEGKPVKYEYPPGASNIFDVLPSQRDHLIDPDVTIYLTEGAKKADAITTALGDQPGLVINENGVWAWRSKGKLLDDFKRFVWEGRHVIFLPDGDVRYNKQVLAAVKRTAALLAARGVASCEIAMLPMEKGGEKTGVDDWLAEGHTLDELEQHYWELDAIAARSRVALCGHPATGEKLYLPAGYDVRGKQIYRQEIAGGSRQFYSGVLLVTDTGRNLHTQEEYATVRFNGRGRHSEVNMPRVDMASKGGCTRYLGASGAAIHEGNAKNISSYLVEFVQENWDALPRVAYVDRLGLVEDGLYLPAGAVGLKEQVKYAGPRVEVGSDTSAYKSAIKVIAEEWGRMPVFWAVFALGLAGPMIARIRPNRNPALYLAGQSGSGKTTLAHFTTGAYGRPDRSPLQVQCGSGSTTPKGMAQTLVQVNGVPTFFDDVHVLWEKDPKRVQGVIYDFANGQDRTFGRLNQLPGGGQSLGGSLLMAGEIIPEFTYAGSQSRTMTFDCTAMSPLGVGKSREGYGRAQWLDAVWESGGGLFGHELCETVWADWAGFLQNVEMFLGDSSLQPLQAWRQLLAIGAATLQAAFKLADTWIPPDKLLYTWSQMYQQSQAQHDPALEAFERVRMMLAQSVPGSTMKTQRADWTFLEYQRVRIACKRDGDAYWRVFCTSPEWRKLVGAGAIEQWGQQWIERGFVLAFPGQRPSAQIRVGNDKLQCVCVPEPTHEDDNPQD